MSVVPVYKLSDFSITDAELISNSAMVDRTKGSFYISYFDGSLKEKFVYKKTRTDLNNFPISEIYVSDYGNKVVIELNKH